MMPNSNSIGVTKKLYLKNSFQMHQILRSKQTNIQFHLWWDLYKYNYQKENAYLKYKYNVPEMYISECTYLTPTLLISTDYDMNLGYFTLAAINLKL